VGGSFGGDEGKEEVTPIDIFKNSCGPYRGGV